MKSDLWKLVARPVAEANSSKTLLRQTAASREALQRIRVSSAYWRIGHGRSEERGVSEGAISPSLEDKALEKVGDDDKKDTGERVPLPKTIATTDPAAWHAI
jgi:hypothetical protein